MSRSLAGKNCLITGANQGLGYQTSLELARRGAKVYMVCRNKERGEQAADAIVKETGNKDVHLKVGISDGALRRPLES
jgi:dehydrogenase/reductase SDR family protein 12